jgi:hypothetical protein
MNPTNFGSTCVEVPQGFVLIPEESRRTTFVLMLTCKQGIFLREEGKENQEIRKTQRNSVLIYACPTRL